MRILSEDQTLSSLQSDNDSRDILLRVLRVFILRFFNFDMDMNVKTSD